MFLSPMNGRRENEWWPFSINIPCLRHSRRAISVLIVPVATALGSATIIAALISSLMFSRSLVGAHPAWRFLPAVG